MKKKILIIDDEDVIRKALERFFGGAGYDVQLAGSGEKGLELLNETYPHIVLVDLKLPGISGVEFLRQARVKHPDLTVIVITGFGTIPSAIEAIHSGAYYYVTKPFDLEELYMLVEKAIDHQMLRKENIVLKQELRNKSRHDRMIGTSRGMQALTRLVDQVARTDSTVLILGESGTGKELLAKSMHYNSDRSAKPLVIVNCGAIPENLLESELFGHVKGAFTGAFHTRAGRFEAANNGTIFLDEIGDMSPNLQVKILRVLQDKKFQPVGSAKTTEVDVRIIAATNQNLEQAVAEGKFREDLFYRLNVIPINICPLRERRDDIPILVEHFLKQVNRLGQKSVTGFAPDAMKLLCHYRWPGNIRELENMVERLVILKSSGLIEVSDLPPTVTGGDQQIFLNDIAMPDHGVSFKNLVHDFERELILKALQKSGGNKNQAAMLLKLNRTTLLEKIRKCRLEKEVKSLTHGTGTQQTTAAGR